MKRLFRKPAIGISVAMFILSSTLLPAQPASAGFPPPTGSGYDGKDPNTTGCSRDAVTRPYAFVGPNGTVIQLRYSPSCRTVWARMIFSVTDWQYYHRWGYVKRNSDGRTYYVYGSCGSYCMYSPMVYDAGVTSYAYGYILYDPNNGLYWSARTANF